MKGTGEMAVSARSIEMMVAAIAALLGVAVTSSAAGSSPYQYKTACGPIAAFVALQQLDRPATLDEVVSRLQWSEGALTQLRTIRNFLDEQPGVTCSGVRISPGQMRDLVDRHGTAVIIAIRKDSDEINHAVCVRSVTPRFVEYVDYPELVVRIPMAMLPDIWDGQALVARRENRDPVVIGLLVADGVAVAGMAYGWILRRRRHSVRLMSAPGGDAGLEPGK